MSDPIIPPYCPPKPWLEREPWQNVHAPLQGELPRTRARWRAVIEQFSVVEAKRYQRRGKDTFCNIFTSDVTRAMGCEIPHWVDVAGNPIEPDMKRGHELRVDGMFDWLKRYGPSRGWRECSRGEAEMAAELGCPTVVMDKDDHIAVVSSGATGLRVTQAGAHNLVDAQLGDCWQAKDIPGLHFFTHP